MYFKCYGFYGIRVAGESFENTIKSAEDLEKVGNRIVAIASVNTCKRLARKL